VKPDEVVEIHTPVSRWLRLANFVIDYIAMIVSVGLLFFIIGMIAGEDGITGLESTPDIVFGVIMFLVYYLPLEALGGRTVGKLVTGTKIVTEEAPNPRSGKYSAEPCPGSFRSNRFLFLGRGDGAGTTPGRESTS
jgi:uncharacterized RDD family membrane protein YckC